MIIVVILSKYWIIDAYLSQSKTLSDELKWYNSSLIRRKIGLSSNIDAYHYQSKILPDQIK